MTKIRVTLVATFEAELREGETLESETEFYNETSTNFWEAHGYAGTNASESIVVEEIDKKWTT